MLDTITRLMYWQASSLHSLQADLYMHSVLYLDRLHDSSLALITGFHWFLKINKVFQNKEGKKRQLFG
jgi:hypothetical protein